MNEIDTAPGVYTTSTAGARPDNDVLLVTTRSELQLAAHGLFRYAQHLYERGHIRGAITNMRICLEYAGMVCDRTTVEAFYRFYTENLEPQG